MDKRELGEHLEGVCKCKYLGTERRKREEVDSYICPFGLIGIVTKGTEEMGDVHTVRCIRYLDKVDIK